MPSATYNLFREAILQEKQVICSYNGEYREVCPVILGRTRGEEKALTFQVGGGSRSGLPPGANGAVSLWHVSATPGQAMDRGTRAIGTRRRKAAFKRSTSVLTFRCTSGADVQFSAWQQKAPPGMRTSTGLLLRSVPSGGRCHLPL